MSKQLKTFALSLPLAVAMSSVALAEDCRETRNYTDTGRGTVVDNKTKLEWMRCPMGMEWDKGKKDCTGVASVYSWNKAKQHAEEMEYAGKKDWRLPNIDELDSLTHNCFNPNIDLSLFPSTPPTGFWSSSEVTHAPRHAWLNHFYIGRSYAGQKEQDWRVRLVRTR